MAAISLGELLNERRSGDFRMGKPTRGNARVPCTESIGAVEVQRAN
jgi:hypothetical protein